jgi:V8-like Glu-specific endopeptidase
MYAMRSRGARWMCALGVAGMLCAAPAVMGQAAPWPSRQAPVQVDSGPVQNLAAQDPIGNAAQVVWVGEVHVPGAEWLRLSFDTAQLSGDPAEGTGSYLMITSMEDGAVQKLDGEHMVYWNNTSAYMNGDAVIIELWSFPGTGVNRVSISEVTAGEPDLTETICGTVDKRVHSNDPRQGRLSTGCTAWLAGHALSANRFLTAGHCISTGTSNAVVLFNVPLSTSTGALRNPPPEYQYPVQQASIQSTNGGVGNDFATFQTFPNSNTGMAPRIAQGSAYPLASAPTASNQTLRVTGYGVRTTAGGVTPVPQEWNQVQKTHTGTYTGSPGNTINHRVDTTGGNSGSPIILESTGSAIGIHTHGGCQTSGTTSSNAGTKYQHTGLQNYLSNPLGTSLPFSTPPSLATLMASNNSGSVGGAVYFDAVVGSSPLDVWGLELNNSATSTAGGTYLVDVYITPNGRAGKQTNANEWTRVARGTGIVSPTNQVSRVVLPFPLRLVQGTRYGVALVLTDAGHAYTNGNNNYSNSALTIETGEASNTPWGSTFNERTFNGRLLYRSLPTTGQCIQTTFESNNGLSQGSTVMMNVDVGPVPTVRVTQVTVNSSSAAGQPVVIDVYRTPTSFAGKLTSPGSWTKVAEGSGTSQGTDNPTTITLNAPFFLNGNSSQGIAIHFRTGAQRYTNGNGFNEVYQNATMRISGGASTSGLFTGSTFEPRIFNGGFCYFTGTGACSGTTFLASSPNPALESRNSNAASGVSTQQVAAPFTPGTNWNVTGLKLWGVYTGNNSVPPAQNFTVNIYNTASGGGPGSLAYSRNVSNVTPTRTQLRHTGFATGRELYEFNVGLPAAFAAAGGRTYWISVLGTTADRTWSWQWRSTVGQYAVRPSATGTWSVLSNSLAFEICGTPGPALCNASSIGSMTVGSSRIDMDARPVGAVTVAQLNAAGSPGNARLSDVIMADKPPAHPGIYDTRNELGNALARVNGAMRIIPGNPVGADFDGVTYELVFSQFHTEFGFEVADYNGTMIVRLYEGQVLRGETTVANSTAVPQFVQIASGCRFDRATIDTHNNSIGNFVLTEVWTEGSAATCYPDCDKNGRLDFFDFLCFQNAFLSQDPYADCDGNRIFDFFDFLCFQNEFLAGCP